MRVCALRAGDNPAQMLVSLDADGTALLARVTRYSSDQLGLHEGQQLWAQIKSVALLG
ncbi:molybdate transporter ATP-binding protein [compost metagenome]